jgi:hypothetical protein
MSGRKTAVRAKSAGVKTYKPDSVLRRYCSFTWVIISLGFELPRTSSDLPEDHGRASRSATLFRVRRRLPIWSCTGRRLPCRSMSPSPRWALTPPFHPYLSQRNRMQSCRPGHRRFDFCGAGVGLLRLGVTQRPALGVRTFLPIPTYRAITRSSHPRR